MSRASSAPLPLGLSRLEVGIFAVLLGAALGMMLTAEPVLSAIGVAVLLTLGMVGISWSRPEIGVVVLVAVLPFQPTIFGFLITHGVPQSGVLLLRYWHTVLLLVLAGKAYSSRSKALQAVDIVALAFIVLVAVFTALPEKPDLIIRINEARPFAGLAIIFLVGRWLPMRPWASRGVQSAILVAGAILGIGAAYNEFAPDGFTHWVKSSGMISYQSLLGEPAWPGVIHSALAGHSVVRAGSLFLSPLALGHFMLVPTGIAIGLAAAGRIRRWEVIAASLAAAGLLMSLTRSAILAAAVMAILVAVMTGRGRGKFLSGLAVAGLVLYPLATLLTIGDQILAGFDLQEGRTAAHLSRSAFALSIILANPIGLGLGRVLPVAENWYLQSGLIFGVLGTVLPAGLVILILGELWKRGRIGDPDAAAAFGALGGLSLAALVLYAFGDISTTYPAFLLAGLATSRRERSPTVDPVEAETDLTKAQPMLQLARGPAAHLTTLS